MGPGDMRFPMVWGDVAQIVGVECVQRVVIAIFCGKGGFMEVSPGKPHL